MLEEGNLVTQGLYLITHVALSHDIDPDMESSSRGKPWVLDYRREEQGLGDRIREEE